MKLWQEINTWGQQKEKPSQLSNSWGSHLRRPGWWDFELFMGSIDVFAMWGTQTLLAKNTPVSIVISSIDHSYWTYKPP